MAPTQPEQRFSSDDPRGSATRGALVRAALELFGKHGYHATSNRALAEAAGVNQALIGYHFGGKRGLYLAVFEHIAERMAERLGPLSVRLQATLEDGTADRAQLVACLLAAVDGYVDLFTHPDTGPWAMLIVREQQEPGDAFDLIWKRIMGRTFGLLGRLVAALRGATVDDPEVRLTVLTIAGQALFFRVARAAALRAMGWTEIGPEEVATIKSRIHRNTLAMLGLEDGP